MRQYEAALIDGSGESACGQVLADTLAIELSAPAPTISRVGIYAAQ